MTRRTDPITPADFARAALLAHNCGDWFGAPQEFATGPIVRTQAATLGH